MLFSWRNNEVKNRPNIIEFKSKKNHSELHTAPGDSFYEIFIFDRLDTKNDRLDIKYCYKGVQTNNIGIYKSNLQRNVIICSYFTNE